MPLQAFAKLFRNRNGKKGLPTGLRKCRTCFTEYNGTNIPQLGTLDTKITWKDKDTKQSTSMTTTWYITNTPEPAILELPSWSHLGIVHLKCAVEFQKCRKSNILKKRKKYNRVTDNTKVTPVDMGVLVPIPLQWPRTTWANLKDMGMLVPSSFQLSSLESTSSKNTQTNLKELEDFQEHITLHSRMMQYQLYTYPGNAYSYETIG